jgi:transcription-repair coupling factor (superfamily II helicase)
VQSIDEIAGMIRMLLPNVRVQVGHGQMKPADLERVMSGFIEKKFDVLVSTNIVESGLDIANANTIIINQANHFGLADLHQLRGRVGRSDQKAFCYLLVHSIHSLTREAKQRLHAVEEFSDLGSGFNIAMRDLVIRGAGNLLGAEQSGFIVDVGYETYHKFLDEAVQELRSAEFSDLFTDAPPPAPSDTVIDVEEDAYIPDHYLANNVERLNLYRRLSEASDREAIEEIRVEMADRFGALPAEVNNLLTATGIRNLAQPLRLTKVVFKNQRLFLEFPQTQADPYFFDTIFQPLLERLNQLENRYVLKDSKKGRLRAIVQDVSKLADGYGIMEKLGAEAVVSPV